jgi:hypothetical protein
LKISGESPKNRKKRTENKTTPPISSYITKTKSAGAGCGEHMPVVQALGKLRQENHEFKTNQALRQQEKKVK